MLVAAYVKTIMQTASQQVLTSATYVKTVLQAASQQVSISKMYGASQAPTSDSDEVASDELEEEDFQPRGIIYREMRQELEKKIDGAAKGQEVDSSEDGDASDCDSDEEGWDEEEEEDEDLAKKRCRSRAVQLFFASVISVTAWFCSNPADVASSCNDASTPHTS